MPVVIAIYPCFSMEWPMFCIGSIGKDGSRWRLLLRWIAGLQEKTVQAILECI